jgi:hypothetical protein
MRSAGSGAHHTLLGEHLLSKRYSLSIVLSKVKKLRKSPVAERPKMWCAKLSGSNPEKEMTEINCS